MDGDCLLLRIRCSSSMSSSDTRSSTSCDLSEETAVMAHRRWEAPDVADSTSMHCQPRSAMTNVTAVQLDH